MPLKQPRRIFVRQRRRGVLRITGLLCLAGTALAFARPLATGLGQLLPAAADPHLVAGENVAVMDGRTLRLGDRVVRLDGVVAPQAGAGPAALQLAALVRFQHVACRVDGDDTAGRSMARCAAGGTDINRALVASGWAEAMADDPSLKQVERTARARHLGIWAR